jgi:DNA-binding beta-propeller fold protein YncE
MKRSRVLMCAGLLFAGAVCPAGFRAEAVESYNFVLKWGEPGTGNGQFNQPQGLAVDSSGIIYVVDTWNHRVQKFTLSGDFRGTWGSLGSADGQFKTPLGVAVDYLGNVYVLDSGNLRVQKFTPSGTLLTKWGSEGTGDGQFGKSPFGGGPYGIAVSIWGEVFVADTWNSRVQVFDSNGKFLRKWGTAGSADGQFNEPRGIATDAEEKVYVSEWGNQRIQRFDYWGAFQDSWGGSGSTDGRFNSPAAVAVDPGYGPRDTFVADAYNNRVQKFDFWGDFLTKWGSRGAADGEFYLPMGIVVDSSGNVYVADTQNHRIQKFSPDYSVRAISGPARSPTIRWNSIGGKRYKIWVSSDLRDWTAALEETGWGVGFNYWVDDGNHPLGPPSQHRQRFYRVEERPLSSCYLLILAPAEFQNALLPLLAHKNSTRSSAMLLTLESIYANPDYSSGRDPQEKIKLAIADANKKYSVQAVMLVGDVDKFPVRYVRGWDSVTWGHSFCPSDLYYADLYDLPDNDPWDLDTGGFDDWDANHNNLFGEMGTAQGQANNWDELNPDKADLKPDIAVGRIPASNAAEVTRMVNKIIAYETASAPAWRKRVMLVTGDWSWSDAAADTIATTMTAEGYTATKHYHTTDWVTYPNLADRISLLNTEMDSGFGFVAYLGHGSGGVTGVPGGNGGAWNGWYTYTSIAGLNNAGKLPIVLAAACATAAFHFPDWPYLDKSGKEAGCFGEEDEPFRKDATFKKVPHPVIPPLLRFESYNYPGSYWARQDSAVYIQEGAADLFQIVAPRHDPTPYWRSFCSYNYSDRYIRHSFFSGELTQITSDLDKEDATFRIVPGLADSTITDMYQCVSFESWNFPGFFLVEEEGRLVLCQRALCNEDFEGRATFRQIAGLADGSAASFESFAKPGHFICHSSFHIYVQEGTGTQFEQDATFRLVAPQYDPTPRYCSLLYEYGPSFVLRTQSGSEMVATVGAVASLTDEIAATFRLVPGLAEPGQSDLVSFEALVPEEVGRTRSYPGYYLRHQYFQLKAHERRPANQRDFPEPASLQPPSYDLDCMAEHFLVKRDSIGAIAYIGCYTGAQVDSFNMVQEFFNEVAAWSGLVVLGQEWKFTLQDFMSEDFPRIETMWGTWGAGALFQHVHKMMLFGDPSLRVD